MAGRGGGRGRLDGMDGRSWQSGVETATAPSGHSTWAGPSDEQKGPATQPFVRQSVISFAREWAQILPGDFPEG